jgi:peptide/nickel transport system permease protein
MTVFGKIGVMLGRNVIAFVAISLLITLIAFLPTSVKIHGGMQDTWSFNGQGYTTAVTSYLKDIVHGDLGTAPARLRWMTNQPDGLISVVKNLIERSVRVLLPGVVFGTLAGVLLGALTFFLPKWANRVLGTANNVVFSVPDLLILFVLQWLAVRFDHAMGSPIIQVVEIYGHPAMFLPITCVATPIAAYMFRYTIQACREAMSQEFVRTARAKGLPNSVVFWKHVMRPATDSILAVMPKMVAIAASSLLIIERLFNILGITTLFLSGIGIPFVMRMLTTVLICLAAIVFLFNITTSLLRLWVNPALRK